MMNTKHKPKSCSCFMCRMSETRHWILKQKQRSFRRKWKIALKSGKDIDSLEQVTYAGYTD